MTWLARTRKCSTEFDYRSGAQFESQRFGKLDGIRFVVTLLFALFCLTAFGSQIRAETVQLVEIIYELDLSSLDGRPYPDAPQTSDDPSGYVLVDAVPGQLANLYSAMNAAPPSGPSAELWAALYYRNHLGGSDGDARTLEAVEALPYSPNFNAATNVAPAMDVSITGINEDGVVITVNGETFTAPVGSQSILANAERTVSVEEFAEALLRAYADAGIANPPARDEVLRQVRGFAPDEADLTFHARLIVNNHGDVELNHIDLAAIWRDAQQMAREGPYDEAVSALEMMLDILPDHDRAARLFHETLNLVEAGAVPAHLIGTVSFPADQPDNNIRKLWEASHEGYAMFAQTDTPAGRAHTVIPILNRQFAAHLPAGTWRLTINVPGFVRSEREVTLEGETDIDVPLTPSN